MHGMQTKHSVTCKHHRHQVISNVGSATPVMTIAFLTFNPNLENVFGVREKNQP